MSRTQIFLVLMAELCLADCAYTATNRSDLIQAYNVAAAVEAAYAETASSNPTTVRQCKALLSSAQGALLAWQNAPAGDSSAEVALSTAIAALVSFEAAMK